MQGTWVIYRRELAGLFLAPLGWVLLFLALFANGLFVYLLLDATRGDVGTVLRSALGGGTLFWGYGYRRLRGAAAPRLPPRAHHPMHGSTPAATRPPDPGPGAART